jgi:hypothetical protein
MGETIMRSITSIIGTIYLLLASQISAEINNRFALPGKEALRTIDLMRNGLLADRSAVTSASSGSEVTSSSGKKSPKLAFFMSLIIPGTGELYAGATKRGIGFLVVEAGSWGAYSILRSGGKDKEKEFRAFAEEHWTFEEYQLWRTSAFTYGDTTHALPFKDEEDQEKNQGQVGRRDVDTQQYYELVGKYDQFVFGWDDRSSDNRADSTKTVQSKNRLTYEDMRNESNKRLKRASSFLGILLFNHVISAIDAAKFTQLHGKTAAIEERLKIRMAMINNGGHQVPILVASKRFR